MAGKKNMEDELVVCNSSSIDWLVMASQELNSDSLPEYTSVEHLLDGVEEMEKQTVLDQSLPIEFPNAVAVEVEVHPPPISSQETNERGRGRGRGRGGRGQGGRGRGTREKDGGRGVNRSQSVPSTAGKRNPKSSAADTTEAETIVSISPGSEVSENETTADHTTQEEDDDVQLVHQMLEHGLNKTANSDQDREKKKTIIEQLKIQFAFSQGNVLNLTHAVNHLAFSSIPTEKNQKYLVGMKNRLQQLTGKISDCFDQQTACVNEMEELLTSSIYKVNPVVLQRSFNPNFENLTPRVIENGMKRKRESEMIDLCQNSRENFRKFLKPTIVRNGKNWKLDGAKIFNPAQFYEVWELLFETYSVIVRDEERYSLVNFPFFDNYKDFETWLLKKKEDDKPFYDAVLKVLTKLAKSRHQAYEDYVKNKISDDVCEDLLKIKKIHMLSVLPVVLKR